MEGNELYDSTYIIFMVYSFEMQWENEEVAVTFVIRLPLFWLFTEKWRALVISYMLWLEKYGMWY